MSNPLSPGSLISEINGNAARPFTAVIHNSKPAPETTESRIRALREKTRVRPTDAIPEPPVCLRVGGARIGTLGNFSMVIGKPKSRKTYWVGSMTAAALSPGIQQVGDVMGTAPSNRRVVAYIDTEQSGYDLQRSLRRICKQAKNENPSNLDSYGLRSLNPDERLELIQHIIYDTPGLYMVIVDGVRDLVYDINSAEEATKIATLLLKWTEDLNIHIVVVLHQNKGDQHARGHLGAELVNKAETVMSVTKGANGNNLISTVAPEQCRSIDFDPFSFGIDADDLPCNVDTPQPPQKGRGKSGADSLTSEQVDSMILRAYTGNDQLAYADLRTNLIEASEYLGHSLAQTKARELIQRILIEKKLEKFRPTKARWDFYRPTQ